MSDGPTQHVIVYDAKEGTAKVFCTAYTERQIEDGIRSCVSLYGRKVNARSMLAKERMSA